MSRGSAQPRAAGWQPEASDGSERLQPPRGQGRPPVGCRLGAVLSVSPAHSASRGLRRPRETGRPRCRPRPGDLRSERPDTLQVDGGTCQACWLPKTPAPRAGGVLSVPRLLRPLAQRPDPGGGSHRSAWAPSSQLSPMPPTLAQRRPSSPAALLQAGGGRRPLWPQRRRLCSFVSGYRPLVAACPSCRDWMVHFFWLFFSGLETNILICQK